MNAQWGDTLVTELKRHKIQDWLATTWWWGSLRGWRPQRPVRRRCRVLRGACQIAVDMEIISKNPCDGVSVGGGKRRDPVFLDAGQLATLASCAREYAPMVWLLGTSGLRIGEACALNVRHVDTKRRRVRISHAKNGRPRDTPILGQVLSQPDLARNPDAPLFVTRRGSRVDEDHWRARSFKPALERAREIDPSIPDRMRIHDLRHTTASLMIASGATIKEVQDALGHSSAKMTLDLYGHRFESALADLTARMEAMMVIPEIVPGTSD